MAQQIQLRNDTAANWTSANPTLAVGEMGVETDTDQFKIGDGTTAWNALPYGGIQGPTGPTGAAGATGPTGPTGPVAGSANQIVYKNASNEPAGSAGLTFDGTNFATTGTISGTAATATAATAASRVGYMGIPASGAGASGAYTLVEADAGELVYSTSPRTVTIPSNASVPFQIGTTIVFIAGTNATTTIAINSDTLVLAGTGTTGSRTLAQHGMATAVKVASTTWYISGNGLT